MIYLLCGDYVEKSRSVLARFIDRFKKEVPHHWMYIDCEDESTREEVIFSQMNAGSLFSNNDYCIIKNASVLPQVLSKVILGKLETWKDDESVIVFYERGVPQKNALFSAVRRQAKYEEFSYPPLSELKRFIKSECKKYRIELSAAEELEMAQIYEKDPSRFFIIFDKVLLGGGNVYRKSDKNDRNLFLLGDIWGRRERKTAFLAYHALLEEGHDPSSILRILLWHVKNIFLAGKGDTKDMKPFVAKKAKVEAQNFTLKELEEAFFHLVLLEDRRKSDLLEPGLLHFLLTH